LWNFTVRGFLEEEDGGQGFAGDVVSADDGAHLVGQDSDVGVARLAYGLRRACLFQRETGEIYVYFQPYKRPTRCLIAS
jgi:hypothetical protein